MQIWSSIATFILRQRIPILVALLMMTGVAIWQAQNVKVHYGFPRLLPDTDSTLIAYDDFRERFGHEGVIMVLGMEEDPLQDVELFNKWFALGNKLNEISGVDTVVSVAKLYNLRKNAKAKTFELQPIVSRPVQSKAELDSIRATIESLPIYRDRIYNSETRANIMAITLSKKRFDSEERNDLVEEILALVEQFRVDAGIDVNISGLPYIRVIITKLLEQELSKHIIFSLIATILILFLFFRSFKPVAISMIVVGLGVAFSFGTLGALGYRITILTSIIPPLIIVIGVPNCIYLINNFHQNFRSHGNKMKALTRVVQRVGKATFMTNATTAAGFFTFVFTQNPVLVEFGIVASINIMILFLISLVLIPITFSYAPPPKDRHLRHLDKGWSKGMVNFFARLVQHHRPKVYAVSIVLLGVGIWGIYLIKTTGNIVDDLPNGHRVLKELAFFEKNFHGVMPFEISIDAQKPGRVTRDATLKRIEKLQDVLAEHKEFSKPLSIVEGVKFSKQAYYNGSPDKYALINNQEKSFFKPYMDNAGNRPQMLNSLIDTAEQFTRVSCTMEDIGTAEMDVLLGELRPQIDSIFNPEKYTVELTGSSVVFLKGTNYLVKNLFISLFLAILIIAFIMALLFSSLRMIVVSLVTNLFPLLLTAAMMGIFNIPIKPSTVLVFSIAFGISVDDTIHFLAKFRQELRHTNWNLGESVLRALKETGVSMVYTSIILYFGFGVFILSEFGGTMALGVLVSMALLIAMLANLILLPSFLMSLDRMVTTKAFRDESLLYIYEDEAEVELDDLEVETNAGGPLLNVNEAHTNGQGSAEDLKDNTDEVKP